MKKPTVDHASSSGDYPNNDLKSLHRILEILKSLVRKSKDTAFQSLYDTRGSC